MSDVTDYRRQRDARRTADREAEAERLAADREFRDTLHTPGHYMADYGASAKDMGGVGSHYSFCLDGGATSSTRSW